MKQEQKLTLEYGKQIALEAEILEQFKGHKVYIYHSSDSHHGYGHLVGTFSNHGLNFIELEDVIYLNDTFHRQLMEGRSKLSALENAEIMSKMIVFNKGDVRELQYLSDIVKES